MEVYDKIKKSLAVAFMNDLDNNRPEGKMCLSNGECADIEKAFNEQDWPKLARYLDKHTESEDERTRNEIITFIEQALHSGGGVSVSEEKENKWLAYLEKQKDAFENGRQFGIMQEQARQELELPNEKQEEKKPKTFNEPYNPDEYEAVEIGNATCLRRKEQKPAEWSEEDSVILDCAVEVVEKAGLPSLAASLKSLRPSWKPSDEDEERLINTSISFLKDFADKGYENAVECIDWLKSKLNGDSGK